MNVCGAAEHLSMECNVVYLNLLCYMGRNCDKIFLWHCGKIILNYLGLTVYVHEVTVRVQCACETNSLLGNSMQIRDWIPASNYMCRVSKKGGPETTCVSGKAKDDGRSKALAVLWYPLTLCWKEAKK